jgi:hypothetical protein
MAIGLSIRIDGGTAEQYDAVQAKMNVDQEPPDGLILHSAGPIKSGWGIIDFWESREQFDAFQESRLGPAIAELGDQTFPGPPEIKEFPVHHITKP